MRYIKFLSQGKTNLPIRIESSNWLFPFELIFLSWCARKGERERKRKTERETENTSFFVTEACFKKLEAINYSSVRERKTILRRQFLLTFTIVYFTYTNEDTSLNCANFNVKFSSLHKARVMYKCLSFNCQCFLYIHVCIWMKVYNFS